MCDNCRFTTFGDKNKLICMNEESDNYEKIVAKLNVSDEFEQDYTMEDTVKKLEADFI